MELLSSAVSSDERPFKSPPLLPRFAEMFPVGLFFTRSKEVRRLLVTGWYQVEQAAGRFCPLRPDRKR